MPGGERAGGTLPATPTAASPPSPLGVWENFYSKYVNDSSKILKIFRDIFN